MRSLLQEWRARRGFALLAVLLVMVSAFALGAALSMTTDGALDAARNRVNLSRATWLAEGCLEHARASIENALSDNHGASAAWRAVDSLLAQSPVVSGCSLEVTPAGTRLDVNSVSENRLRALLQAAGVSAEPADSLVDALMDWRDTDDEPRPLGAERSWYESHQRPGPRNGPFASTLEFALVRGFTEAGGLDTLLGVERERIWLDRAPLPVLATLPGMSAEALIQLAQKRKAGKQIGDLAAIADGLSEAGKETLMAHFAELIGLTTNVPEAWRVAAKAVSGSPSASSTVEIQLMRAGDRAAIVRRRTWP